MSEMALRVPDDVTVVKQLERDDHLCGRDALVGARGPLEECLLGVRFPLGVHRSGLPGNSTSYHEQAGSRGLLFKTFL